MARARCACALAFLIFPFLSKPLFPQAQSNVTWRLGLCELSVNASADPASRYMASSIPLLLIRTLASASTRLLTDKEVTFRRAILARSELAKAAASLAKAKSSRDALVLSLKAGAKDIASTVESLKKAEDDYARLLDSSGRSEPSKDPSSVELPIALWEGHAKGLLIPNEAPIASIAHGYELDGLLYGSVMEVSGYYLVKIAFHERASGAEWRFEDACSPVSTEAMVERLATVLMPYILGKESGSLRIVASPASSAIYVNGSLRGIGTVELKGLNPGTLSVRAEAPGYREKSAIAAIEAQAVTSLELTLEKGPSRMVLVESEPSGAFFSLDGVRVGQTPLEFESLDAPLIGKLSLDGYHERSFSLFPGDPGVIKIMLAPIGPKAGDIVMEKKDEFYRALGWVLVGMGVTSLTWGLFDTMQRTIAATGTIDAELWANRYVSLGFFAASGAATATAFYWAAVSLSAYISAAGDPYGLGDAIVPR